MAKICTGYSCGLEPVGFWRSSRGKDGLRQMFRSFEANSRSYLTKRIEKSALIRHLRSRLVLKPTGY